MTEVTGNGVLNHLKHTNHGTTIAPGWACNQAKDGLCRSGL